MVRLIKRLICHLFLVLLLALAVFFLFLCHKMTSKRCTKEGSLAILRKLCALYAVGKVDGNFCPKICSSSSFQYERCFNRVEGKKVMEVMVDDRRAVLKSRHANLSEYEPLFQGLLNEDSGAKSSDRLMTRETFASVVHDRIQSTFGIKLDVRKEELLRRVLVGPGHISEDFTTIQMNSLWALLQQEEYLFFTFFKEKSFFPEIYGACGHFYVEEYFPPSAILQQLPSHGVLERYQSSSWQRRAKAAIGLLDIVRATETEFKDILHLCDVKPENFGIVDSRVKAIDIDISFFDNTMRNFLEQPDCTSDKDCDFFDCHGKCNLAVKKCTRERKNNNFQAICNDVFLRKVTSPGLLRHSPPKIEEEISQLLQKCVYPDEGERVAKGSTTETFQRLYRLLSDSIERGDQ